MPPQIPIGSQRWMLQFRAAHLQCLDIERRLIPGAQGSGFIRLQDGKFFLYTCWHVVSGFDPAAAGAPPAPPTKRHFLRVSVQDCVPYQGGKQIGGAQVIDVGLYRNVSGSQQPVWLQDALDVAHLEVNSLGMRVPAQHDAIRIQLPDDLRLSELQLIDEARLFGVSINLIVPGDKVCIVGFPHGFSAVGMEQPTPVILTRFVAGASAIGQRRQYLLESIGGAGMSGGPVFLDSGNDLLLFGIYTGLIFPDYLSPNPEKATALGTVTDLTEHFLGRHPFVEAEVAT